MFWFSSTLERSNPQTIADTTLAIIATAAALFYAPISFWWKVLILFILFLAYVICRDSSADRKKEKSGSVKDDNMVKSGNYPTHNNVLSKVDFYEPGNEISMRDRRTPEELPELPIFEGANPSKPRKVLRRFLAQEQNIPSTLKEDLC